jgi:hypothetical protein
MPRPRDAGDPSRRATPSGGGYKSANAVLASLISALVAMGLVTDSTT